MKRMVWVSAALALCNLASAQQSTDKVMQDFNARLAELKAQSAAVEKAARATQAARFKAHPEELNDPHRCDAEKFTGTKQEQWWNLVACQDVSGLTAERERAREELVRWRASECVKIDDCKAQVRDLRERFANVRSWRAESKLFDEPAPKGWHLTPEPYPPCAITPLACGANAEQAEAFSAIEDYYRRLLKERDEELAKVRGLLEKKEEQDEGLDRLLDDAYP